MPMKIWTFVEMFLLTQYFEIYQQVQQSIFPRIIWNMFDGLKVVAK